MTNILLEQNVWKFPLQLQHVNFIKKWAIHIRMALMLLMKSNYSVWRNLDRIKDIQENL